MQSVDNILSSQFGRRAVETGLVLRNGRPCAANFLRELLEEVAKLAQHCQLSEFTEHGLPHLGSLVDRIQTFYKRMCEYVFAKRRKAGKNNLHKKDSIC